MGFNNVPEIKEVLPSNIAMPLPLQPNTKSQTPHGVAARLVSALQLIIPGFPR